MKHFFVSIAAILAASLAGLNCYSQTVRYVPQTGSTVFVNNDDYEDEIERFSLLGSGTTFLIGPNYGVSLWESKTASQLVRVDLNHKGKGIWTDANLVWSASRDPGATMFFAPDGSINLVDLTTGNIQKSVQLGIPPPIFIHMIDDSRAFIGYKNAAAVWDIDKAKRLEALRFKKNGIVHDLTYSASIGCNRIVIGDTGNDQIVSLELTNSGELSSTHVDMGDSYFSDGNLLVCSDTGKVAMAKPDGEVLIWESDGGVPIKISLSEFELNSIAINATGTLCAAKDAQGNVNVIQTANSEVCFTQALPSSSNANKLWFSNKYLFALTPDSLYKFDEKGSWTNSKIEDKLSYSIYSQGSIPNGIVEIKYEASADNAGIWFFQNDAVKRIQTEWDVVGFEGTGFLDYSPICCSRNFVFVLSANGLVEIQSRTSGQEIESLQLNEKTGICRAISTDIEGTHFVVGGENGFEVWKKENGSWARHQSCWLPKMSIVRLGSCKDGNCIFGKDWEGKILAWFWNGHKYVEFYRQEFEEGSSILSNRLLNPTFSVSGNYLLTHMGLYRVFETREPQLVTQVSFDGIFCFDEDDTIIEVGDNGACKIWRIPEAIGSELSLVHEADISLLASEGVSDLSVSGKLLFARGLSNIVVFNKNTLERLAEIVTVSGKWMAISESGQFETSTFRLDDAVRCVISDDPYRALSPEIFSRDYFEPNMLGRMLVGEKLPSPRREIAKLNRVQPEIDAPIVEVKDDSAIVKLRVKAIGNKEIFGIEPNEKEVLSDAFDLRLFRDGQLVWQYPSPDEDSNLELSIENDEQLEEWRTAYKIAPKKRNSLMVATGNGWYEHTLTIPLPRHRPSDTNVEFSTYCFNEDRVKSKTRSTTKFLKKSEGKVERKAYIICMGVNASENRRLDLRFANNDAKVVQQELGRSLENEYTIFPKEGTLSSQYEGKRSEGFVDLSEVTATKRNLRTVLTLLSGGNLTDEELKALPEEFRNLPKCTPDDVVIIYASTHGFTAPKTGMFYLFPYDVGVNGDGPESAVLKNCISSSELSRWLREVDAAQHVLILDTCMSEGAVKSAGSEFKPGPFGSRGLGQLAYDKAMIVLAASQSDEYAISHKKLEHGLLTYTLLQGLGALEGQKESPITSRHKEELSLSRLFQYAVDETETVYAAANAAGSKFATINEPWKQESKDELGKNWGTFARSMSSTQKPVLYNYSNRKTLLKR